MPIKSGRYWVGWVHRFGLTSKDIKDLEQPFRAGVEQFITALENARAKVVVEHTWRSDEAAYLFHWAYRIAKGTARPKDPPRHRAADIQWDHGVNAQSRKGAQEMVTGFMLTSQPSLDSRHKEGKAIDMKITWTGTIQVLNKYGTPVDVPFMINVNANRALRDVAESYGVRKLTTSKVHWSTDGR